MVSVALALMLMSSTAAQAAATPAPVARPASFGIRWGLDASAKMAFEVSTSAGVVKGTIDVVRLDVRGLDGYGTMEVRGALDPGSVDVGDPVLNGHIARTVLRADAGPFVFGANRRLLPIAKPGEGTKPEDELFGAGLYLDQRRSGKYLEVRYGFTRNPDGSATVKAEYTAPLKAFGLQSPSHPFVSLNGPIKLRLNARVVRR